MAILPLHGSIKLQSTNASLQATGTKQAHVMASATITRTSIVSPSYQTRSSTLEVINNSQHHKAMFQEFSLRLNNQHQTLIKDNSERETRDVEKKIESIIQKLKTAVESIREMEIKKFMDRVNGMVSYDDSMLVEKISNEIVTEFLEKPIRYLRCCHGNLEEKIKDVSFLVRTLEESCFKN